MTMEVLSIEQSSFLPWIAIQSPTLSVAYNYMIDVDQRFRQCESWSS